MPTIIIKVLHLYISHKINYYYYYAVYYIEEIKTHYFLHLFNRGLKQDIVSVYASVALLL